MAAAPVLPLITDYRPDRPFAWRGGEPVSQGRALAEIQHLTAALDPGRAYLNLCEDRYLFTLAFAAIALAGGTSLLPQSRADGVLESLRADYPRAGTLDDAGVATHLSQSDEPAPVADLPNVPAAHLAAIVFTSGSTGRPSPQCKYWRDLHTGAELCRRRFFADQPACNIVATVPPQHMYGLETSVLPALMIGCAAHAGRPFTPWDVAAALAEVPAPRVLVTTPIHLRACLQAEGAMPSIDLIICATAPLPAELAARAETEWGSEVREIYGCTEAGSLASRRTTADDIWTLYDGMRLEQADGACQLTGPQLPEPVPLGDRLELIDEQRFRLLGRAADMIKLAGKRLSLTDLNDQLLALDGVDDAIAFVPGTGAHQRPAALVVAPRLDAREIAARLARRIDPVFVPRPLLRVERLPRNAVGKLPRAQLEALLAGGRGRPPA